MYIYIYIYTYYIYIYIFKYMYIYKNKHVYIYIYIKGIYVNIIRLFKQKIFSTYGKNLKKEKLGNHSNSKYNKARKLKILMIRS